MRKRIKLVVFVVIATAVVSAVLLSRAMLYRNHMNCPVQSITVQFSPLVMAQRQIADNSATYSESQLASLTPGKICINVPVDPQMKWGTLIVSQCDGARAYSVRPERCAIVSVSTESGRYELAVTNAEFAAWFQQLPTQGELILVGDGRNYCRFYSAMLPALITTAVRQNVQAKSQLQLLGW